MLNYLQAKAKDREIMVPLTSSLYVPGVMNDNNRVMVEVGAGYFIEESADKAKEYCDRKVKMLDESGKKVGEIIQVKKMQLGKINTEYQKRVEQVQQ